MQRLVRSRGLARALSSSSYSVAAERRLCASLAGPPPRQLPGEGDSGQTRTKGKRHRRRTRKHRSGSPPFASSRDDVRNAAPPPPPPPQHPSPYTTSSIGFYGATEVPRSLDVGAREELMDVERFFPSAMAHLKAPPTTAAAAAGREDRVWHEATHALNVDGYHPRDRPSPEDAAAQAESRSFFDQGSVDIRGAGLLRGPHPGRGGEDGRQRHRPPPPQSRQERLSPDILQLTGGKPRLHGAALAAESNAAPADQTLEVEDGNYMGKMGDQGSAFGDTPVQLTDMLRERLMELKGNKLREERNDAFMPRRLPLKTDAELAREQQLTREQGEQQRLLQLAKRATAKGKRDTTLADLVEPEEEEEDLPAGRAPASAPVPAAIYRDGVSPEQQRRAASVLQRVHRPHSSAQHAADLDPLSDLERPFAARFSRDGGADGEPKDGVYLLRVLPRASFCSRREASAMIASGQVRVNNVVERNPFRLVTAEEDVHVSGHQSRLRFSPTRLWIYHKPANVVVSRNDVAGRTLIGKHARILGMDHLVPVGSLPMRAHGILLLTNDGELSRYLENPRANMQQTYLLRVRPAIDAVLAHKLNTQGIHINGRQYRGAMEFLVNPAAKSRYSVKVKVRGDSLPVAHVMQHLGRTIERGGRVSFGPFALSTLPVGSLREVTVPPFYAEHLGAVWKPFVERDWPYFRRQRVTRLRRLARFRELTPREAEELDNFTYEEMREALSFDEQELAAAADAREESMENSPQRPSYFHGEALPHDFPSSPSPGGAGSNDDVNTLLGAEWADHLARDTDAVIEDITSVV